MKLVPVFSRRRFCFSCGTSVSPYESLVEHQALCLPRRRAIDLWKQRKDKTDEAYLDEMGKSIVAQFDPLISAVCASVAKPGKDTGGC